MANVKHTTGVRVDGQPGGDYGTGASAKGRQPAADNFVYNPGEIRQYPEMFGGQSTD